MTVANYKVTITDRDYNYTTYTAWVQATSRNQALVKGAALAGQEKTRRQFGLMGRESDLEPCGLMNPEVRLELVSADEYYERREEVAVTA